MTVWLFFVVALTNLAADPIAQVTGWPAQRVFYVLRGFEGALLFWLVTTLAPRVFRYVWLVVCAWGFAESAMTAACGSLDLMWPVRPRLYAGLCDIHSGLPLYWVSLMVAALIALAIGDSRDRGS